MSSEIKLTDDELNMVTSLNSKKEILTQEINYVAQQQVVLDYRKKVVDQSYEEIVIFERQITTTLTEKYGKGTIEIEKGVFIPA